MAETEERNLDRAEDFYHESLLAQQKKIKGCSDENLTKMSKVLEKITLRREKIVERASRMNK